MKQVSLTVALLTCLITFLSSPAWSKETIALAVTQGVADHYHKFVAEKGGDPMLIDDVTSKWSRRSVVEILLIQRALHLGGLDVATEFFIVPNPARGIQETKQGHVVMYTGSMWMSNFDETVHMTIPAIERGEYEVGVFTIPKNEKLLTTTSLKQLRRYRPTVSQSWHMDIRVLKKMGFTNIVTPPTYPLIFKLIADGRGDFTMLSFSAIQGEEAVVKGIRLAVVPNIKIQFPHSRHFMISKKHPLGDTVYEAMNKGMAILRKDGTIRRLYEECGFIDINMKDWKVINEPDLKMGE